MRKFFYFLGISLFFACLATIGGIAGLLYGVAQYLPEVGNLAYVKPSETTKIYARDGTLLANLFMENREVVALKDIAKPAKEAVVAIEDSRFYEHRGVDAIGIARAAWANFQHKRIVQGASTITQQMARAVFLTRKRSYLRKIQEILLSLQIERNFSKDEILKIYLNKVYFGEGAYGIEAAAEKYFHKKASDLELHEAALLAGLLQLPSKYSPYKNPDLAERRRNIVLNRMAELGFITQEQAEQAKEKPLSIAQKGSNRQILRAPYFTSYVIEQLIKEYGVDQIYKGGLRIYTSVDLSLQALADKLIKDGVKRAKRGHLNISQGAIAVVQVGSGEVLSLVGGTDFKKSEFNRAWQAHRQPGSAFKPFVYLAALDNGYHPYDVMVDEPITFSLGGRYKWQPKNYDHRYRGALNLVTALVYSINVIAVKLNHEIGPETVIDYVNRLGIDSVTKETDAYLAMALGGLTYGVSPLQMAAAFAGFGNDGIFVKPRPILKITDAHGFLIKEYLPEQTQVVRPEIARTLTWMLSQVISRGTGRRANIGRPAAGKTGTTSDFKDAWFVGYTPDMSAAIWVGNDKGKPTRHVAGGTLPAMLWAKYMRAAHKSLPVSTFAKPDAKMIAKVAHKEKPKEKAEVKVAKREVQAEKVTVEICTITGKRATPYCPSVVLKTMPASEVPPLCPVHTGEKASPPPPSSSPPLSLPAPTPKHAPKEKMVQVDICAISHKLANEYCPTVISKKMPASQAPKEICDIHGPPKSGP